MTKFVESWAYPVYSPSMMTYGAYLNGVCDWSGVTDASDLTLPVCSYGDTTWCKGHYENDMLEFGDFLGKGETYTNKQFYTFMNPWNEDLPYTYDTFDYDYCTENGFDLMDEIRVPPTLQSGPYKGAVGGM